MKFINRILSRKITAEQAIRTFKDWVGSGVTDQKTNELFDAAFPQNNAAEMAVEAIENDLKRLDTKSNRQEQMSLLESIYLRKKGEQKLAHQIGSKADESMVLLFVWAIDQSATENVIVAFEQEGDAVLERYTKAYRVDYLRRWLLYVLIDVGLSSTYEDLFGKKIDKALINRYELMLDDHIKKMTAELLMTFDTSLWTTLNALKTSYDFSAVESRAAAMAMFLDGVEKDDAAVMNKATTDYVKAIELNRFELSRE